MPPNTDMPRFLIGTEYPDPAYAWYFDTSSGFQGYDAKDWGGYALALHAGDIGTPIPEPKMYIMLIIGLIFIGSMVSRREKTAP